MLTATCVIYKQGVLKEPRLEVKSPSSFYKLQKTSWAINRLFIDLTGEHAASLCSTTLNTLTLLPLEHRAALLLVHTGVRNEVSCVLAVVGYLDLVNW